MSIKLSCFLLFGGPCLAWSLTFVLGKYVLVGELMTIFNSSMAATGANLVLSDMLIMKSSTFGSGYWGNFRNFLSLPVPGSNVVTCFKFMACCYLDIAYVSRLESIKLKPWCSVGLCQTVWAANMLLIFALHMHPFQ